MTTILRMISNGEEMTEATESIRDFILAESRKGNVVCAGLEGLQIASLDEFIKQPAEGILYDLNRLPEVVLTFIDDPKWINDYAVQMVITRLRELVKDAELERQKEQ